MHNLNYDRKAQSTNSCIYVPVWYKWGRDICINSVQIFVVDMKYCIKVQVEQLDKFPMIG